MKAILIEKTGGPEVLTFKDVADPKPAAGEALVRVHSVGVNYIDVYHRNGWYPMPLPFTPGLEASGEVVEVAPGVTEVAVGDRVAFGTGANAYAQLCAVPAWKLIRLPEEISFETGAAAMLQGMTADYLVHGASQLKAGQTVLVHAAAGGVGLLLVQMAKAIGAKVIGTVSSELKAKLATDAGVDEIVLYKHQDFEAEVKRITKNVGCDVVYDSVGLTTFEKSLNCLRPRGILVLFGQASGPVPPFDPALLSRKGSLFLTRPTLHHYTATRAELSERLNRLFSLISSNRLKLRIEKQFSLAEASTAHSELEARLTSGKVLLLA